MQRPAQALAHQALGVSAVSKYVLALDTSVDVVSLGIAAITRRPLSDRQGAFELIDSRVIDAPRRANQLLLEEIDALLRDNDIDRGDISRVITGRGPGSFTGVRIGMATAQGLAKGLRVPLSGVIVLDAIAARAALSGHEGPLLVICDAMRREIYPALYTCHEGVASRLSELSVGKPAEVLPAFLEQARSLGENLLVTGNGLTKYRAIVEELCSSASVQADFAAQDAWYADGAGLVEAYRAGAARILESRGSDCELVDTGDPAHVLPVYLRLSDAEEDERARCEAAGQAPAAADLLSTPAAFEPPALVLRPLTPRDIDAMIALEEVTPYPSWTVAKLEDEFDQMGRVWVGLFERGTLRGFAGAVNFAGEIHVLDIVVAPAARRRGYASQLMRELFMRALMWRSNSITLEVRASNEAAIALYEGMGFTLEGERPAYYPPAPSTPDGPRETALIYWASIVDEETAQDWFGREAAQARSLRDGATHDGARLLALESSCDETAAAVVEGNTIRSSIIASQIDFHARFGGVVPEIASRKHIEAVCGVLDAALEDAGASRKLPSGDEAHYPLPVSALDALAVTVEPGLIGALVVGVAFMKGFAFASARPLYGVNHLEGHIYANVLTHPAIKPPFVALVVSGGHTSLISCEEPGAYRTLGETLDDATGEAFDKVAKAMGLPYPGGPRISALALEGNPAAIDFPRAMMKSGDYAFSLSGLKTAVMTYLHAAQERGEAINKADVAASFQQAVIDVQVAKAVRAVQEMDAQWFLLAGGVAANRALREALTAAMKEQGVQVSVPELTYCTDNAAMIARVAVSRIGTDAPLELGAEPRAHAPLDELAALIECTGTPFDEHALCKNEVTDSGLNNRNAPGETCCP